MSKEEIYITTYGEMMDMLACMAIYSGSAKPKKHMSFDDILMME